MATTNTTMDNREAIAQRAVETTNTKFGGDPNIRAYGGKMKPGSGGYKAPATNDSYAGIEVDSEYAGNVPAATPTVAPIMQPEPQQPGAITPQEGLAKALESGVEAPQDAGEARSQIQQYLPKESTAFYKPSPTSDNIYDAQGNFLSFDQYKAAGGKGELGSPFPDVQQGLPQNTALNQQLEADPGYQELLQARKEYNDVANQRTSLTQEYDKLSKKLGIDSLNTELMNMKNVIEGSEDDLRTEITKAGGFATESQVQALTMARNKQLVKNYNNLLETKQMAMETLNTMIGLVSQDRQYAQQVALQKFNIETQVIEYKNKMKENSANQLNKLAEIYGYGALQSGDPWQDALTERTLGLPPGGLTQLSSMKTIQQQQFEAQQAQSAYQFEKGYALDEAQFGLEQDKFAWDIDPTNPANASTTKPNTSWQEINGKRVLVDDTTGQIINDPSSSSGGDETQQAIIRDNVSQMDRVLSDLEKPSTVGVGTGGWRDFFTNPFTGKKSNFTADLSQITSQVVGKTLGDLKAQGATFGALSNEELLLVQQAASKISSFEIKDKNGKVTGYNASPENLRAEIRKLSSYAKLSYVKAGGNPVDIGIPQNPDGSYGLNVAGKMLNIRPQASTQVKGSTPQTKSFMPQLSTGVEGKKVPLMQAYPQGSTGGQCGIWVRGIVEKQGLTYPRVGDSLSEKAATARRYGVPMSQAKQGSVMLTSENKTNGHVVYITGRNAQGFIVAESNYGMNGKVSYGRVIPYSSPAILGILNPYKA